MLVFPANDNKYKQRKHALKACLPCRQRRRKCVLSDSGTCLHCQRASIQCKYDDEDVRPYELRRSVSSSGQMTSNPSPMFAVNQMPSRTQSGSVPTLSTFQVTPAGSQDPGNINSKTAPFKPLRLTGDVMSASSKRPGLVRATSHNGTSSSTSSMSMASPGNGSLNPVTAGKNARARPRHKRTSSHTHLPYEKFLNLGLQDTRANNPFATGLSSPLSNTTTPDGNFADSGYFSRTHTLSHLNHYNGSTSGSGMLDGRPLTPDAIIQDMNSKTSTAAQPSLGGPVGGIASMDDLNISVNSIDLTAMAGNNKLVQDSMLLPEKPARPLNRESIGVWVKGVTTQQQLNPHLHAYLASVDAFSMPLRPNRDALINIYFESIHSILPLVEKEPFLRLHSMGQAPTLLLHAVMLAAARHQSAKLYLGEESPRQFCASTAAKIRALMFAEVEQDKLTLVRTYALLSFHAEGPDGLDLSCSDLGKAIHYAVSLGIHNDRSCNPHMSHDVRGPNDTVQAKTASEIQSLRLLWWSLWCMDRISACVNARPLVLNSEDVGIPPIYAHEHANLAQMIHQCNKLEQVIHMYRPVMDGRQKTPPRPLEFPSILNDTSFLNNSLFLDDNAANPTYGVFALLHYIAVTLAYKRLNANDDANMDRRKRQKFAYQHASDSILLHLAGSIIRVIAVCDQIVPLPLIPYCLSLTLTVFLRAYPQHDVKSGASWQTSCQLLETLSDRWWVAGVMGSMGRNLFKNLEEEEETRNMELRYLNMFSDLPNQTSFLDQAMNLDQFADLDQWLQEKP